ncbi:MAG TPA: bi-domain-containing oxidoreductase [Burkholderiales bacterium]|nr:bi-domain-containing oxidoreductase [Burkholderiales bacterium]
MKQIMQSLGTGNTELAEIPCPVVKPGYVLIRTQTSLVSSGTERTLVDFGKASLVEKALQQPERVRTVFNKIFTDGLMTTIENVRNRLDTPLPVGYCNAGVVLEVGEGVSGLIPGDRVLSNGQHAEVVCVPKNLCAKIPDGVGDEEAAFAVIGAIGLQGIRLAQPTLGETIAVTGLGLIGLMTVQLLRAHGCRVIGIDFDAKRLAMAREFGADTVDLARGEDPVAIAKALTRGAGVDAVLITAATDSNEPVHQAAQMCRKRGRIVLVGVTGLELSRADFYEKELSFQVSCSYGPGRYDPAYEQSGQDYPLGFVRWTAQRNFEAVLDMMASRRIDVKTLVSHRFDLGQAPEAYRILTSDASPLGILLKYASPTARPDNVLRTATVALHAVPSTAVDAPVVGFVGAGNYASNMLIPAFRAAGASLRSLASATGISGAIVGRRFGFGHATTDVDSLMNDLQINTVVVATRHDSHALLVCRALALGKSVFVEKPLAVDRAGLELIRKAYADPVRRSLLMVGFNRRFAPHIKTIKSLLEGVHEPKTFVMTVNAGAVPADHWTQNRKIGGGRIVGEACHFIDLLRHLAGQSVSTLTVTALGNGVGDNVSIALTFSDGSIGTIHYLANGHKSFPKERLEIFCIGRILQLDNFRRLHAFGWPGFSGSHLWRQDKGQNACVAAFVQAVRSGGASPIPFDELVEVAELSLRAAEALDRC